jgi:3-ketoacyl-CoA synthase
VIEQLAARLRLPPRSADASSMTLRWFGNTSSTSVWYELAFLEATRRVRRRHRVWQLALGSGFKCFSAVWEAARDDLACSPSNPWRDFLDYGHDDDDDDDDDATAAAVD